MMAERGGPVTAVLDEHRREFEKVYFTFGWPLRKVAAHFKVSLWGLETWMVRRRISSRGRSEAQKLRRSKGNRQKIVDDIILMRLKHRMTMEEIASKTGFSSKASVYNILAPIGLAGFIGDLPDYDDYLKGVGQREKP